MLQFQELYQEMSWNYY